MVKFDGEARKLLEDRQVKQIAGRAGRYRVDHLDDAAPGGLVTTLKREDMYALSGALKTPNADLTQAQLWPPAFVFQKYANEFPAGVSLASMVSKFAEITRTSKLYHAMSSETLIRIAQAIQHTEGLDLETKYHICACPVNTRKSEEWGYFLTMARLLGEGKPVNVESEDLNLPLRLASRKINEKYGRRFVAMKFLQSLETLHKTLIMFSWISYLPL
jgi:ATP-dependent RNA helicase SUPV3L1/SUV3